MLPTEELFWLNIEEGYFACQVSRYLGLSRNIYNIYIPFQLNQSQKFLKIFKISRLCDFTEDCYQGSDELSDELR